MTNEPNLDPDLEPVITTFTWQYAGFGYEFYGHIDDEDPQGCDLILGGVLLGEPISPITIEEDGSFSFYCGGLTNVPGDATAQAIDPFAQLSNVKVTFVE